MVLVAIITANEHGFVTSYVTLEHKTSHKGTFGEIEIYASSGNSINNISINVWFGQYL